MVSKRSSISFSTKKKKKLCTLAPGGIIQKSKHPWNLLDLVRREQIASLHWVKINYDSGFANSHQTLITVNIRTFIEK